MEYFDTDLYEIHNNTDFHKVCHPLRVFKAKSQFNTDFIILFAVS